VYSRVFSLAATGEATGNEKYMVGESGREVHTSCSVFKVTGLRVTGKEMFMTLGLLLNLTGATVLNIAMMNLESGTEEVLASITLTGTILGPLEMPPIFPAAMPATAVCRKDVRSRVKSRILFEYLRRVPCCRSCPDTTVSAWTIKRAGDSRKTVSDAPSIALRPILSLFPKSAWGLISEYKIYIYGGDVSLIKCNAPTNRMLTSCSGIPSS
jgi:hypothetical protein